MTRQWFYSSEKAGGPLGRRSDRREKEQYTCWSWWKAFHVFAGFFASEQPIFTKRSDNFKKNGTMLGSSNRNVTCVRSKVICCTGYLLLRSYNRHINGRVFCAWRFSLNSPICSKLSQQLNILFFAWEHSMKNLFFLVLCTLICSVARCDEAWSSAGNFDGSELSTESFLLLPTDPLPYSSFLADGTPVSLTIMAVNSVDSSKTAEIFSDNSGTAVEGIATWDYTDSDLPKNDAYTITQTVVSSSETKSFSRSVTILPEPAFFALLAVAGLLFPRKRRKILLSISAIAALSSLGAKADVVSDVNFRQMLPFTRNVIITYTMTPAENTVYDIKFYGSIDDGATSFDLEERGTLRISSLDETFYSAGAHRAEWTPDESFYDTATDKFKVKVEAKEITVDKYMVIDLSGGTGAASYPVIYLGDVPTGGWTEEYKTTKMVLRKVEAGTFSMGSASDELGREWYEKQHLVTLTESFYACIFEVTQKQYELVMGSNPSQYKGDARPVEKVSYNMLRGENKGTGWPANNDVDETSFFGVLRAKTNLTCDLPTEAQWEFACRAGTTTALNSGKNLSNKNECEEMAEVGRYSYNKSDGKGGFGDHTTVGSYLPNAWGLYDMHGNIRELCLDWRNSAYDDGPAVDPRGPSSANNRVVRGGSCSSYAYQCRSAKRDSVIPTAVFYNVGFRVFIIK